MTALQSLINQYYEANRSAVKAEIELRHGEIISERNMLVVQGFAVKGEDYAICYVDEVPVIFVTVNWGDPSVKFNYL